MGEESKEISLTNSQNKVFRFSLLLSLFKQPVRFNQLPNLFEKTRKKHDLDSTTQNKPRSQFRAFGEVK